VERAEALRRLRAATVGRLATVTADGRPHVVPFVFALIEDDAAVRAYWAVDDKPKRSTALRRLHNLEANPVAEFVVDGYDDDWNRLWWVRASGTSHLVRAADERASARDALRSKYPQYRDLRDDVPLVVIDVERVTGWSAEQR
jgi:PPOX class probable F420-dependent enzyme